MSIIHDALKKVDQNQNIADNKPPMANSPWDEPKAPSEASLSLENTILGTPQNIKPSIPLKIKSVLALICAVSLLLISVEFLHKQLNKNASYILPRSQKPSHLTPLAALTITPPASKQTGINLAKPITLNIQGVMTQEGGNVILINDQVYQQGDVVNGAKIIKIELDAVTVFVNGKEEIIPVGK